MTPIQPKCSFCGADVSGDLSDQLDDETLICEDCRDALEEDETSTDDC